MMSATPNTWMAMALPPVMINRRRMASQRNEMKMGTDGSVSVGSMIWCPLLDDFIKEHPDFSYAALKACIAFTGYNGIPGLPHRFAYNTDVYKAETPGFQL